MAKRAHPDFLQVISREAGQDFGINSVVVESRGILVQAQALEPRCNIHMAAPGHRPPPSTAKKFITPMFE
nr:hypothetical protein [Sinorhizobium meliloti]